MRRREVIAVIAGAAVAPAVGARAQQGGKTYRTLRRIGAERTPGRS